MLPFGCYKSCSCGHSLCWIPHCGSPAAMFPSPSCPVVREADLNAASQWLLVGRSKGRRSRQGIYLSGPLPRGPVCWLLYTTPSPSLPHSAQVNSHRRYYLTAFLFLPLLDPLIRRQLLSFSISVGAGKYTLQIWWCLPGVVHCISLLWTLLGE